MLFISGGEVFHQQVGALSYDLLQQTVDRVLDSAGSLQTAAS
jgi:hypothetical protein